MRGVLPKKNPNTYAITSLQTIIETGTINLKHSEHYSMNLPQLTTSIPLFILRTSSVNICPGSRTIHIV
jgi:hypothetical protein